MDPPELCCALGARVKPSRMLRLHCVLAPAFVGWLLATGCGPSFEAIQEGDLRFAHCDRLDLEPNVSPTHRLHCWREWRRMYTYGQTRDRLEYAQRRIAEVVSGDTEPPFELPSGGSRPPSSSSIGTPSPVHSPPPSVVPIAGTGAAQTQDAAPAGDAPACHARCDSGRAECAPRCETEATGCQSCEDAFQACNAQCKSAQP